MLDFVAEVRSPLKERLEAMSRARHTPVSTLLEEAVDRWLQNEEHCEALYRAYGRALDTERTRGRDA